MTQITNVQLGNLKGTWAEESEEHAFTNSGPTSIRNTSPSDDASEDESTESFKDDIPRKALKSE